MVFGTLSKLGFMKNEEAIEKGDELHAASAHSNGLNLSWYSASIQLNHFNLYVDLEDDSDRSSVISISLTDSMIGSVYFENIYSM